MIVEGGGDPASGEFLLAVEALGVGAKQYLDAVVGPFGYLCGRYSPIEPGGQAGVPQVVGAAAREQRYCSAVNAARSASFQPDGR